MAVKGKTSTKNTKRKKNKTPFSKDERLKLLLGLFTLFFTVYLLFGFISYLFTWQADQSKLDIPLGKLISDSSISIENWAGKLGGLLAHTFMHNWFGLGSFGFLLVLGLLGFRFLGFRFLPLRKTLKFVLIYMIWLSVALGFLFHESIFAPGGAHGYFVSHWLNAFMGKVGTAFVLLVTLIGILSFSFDSFILKLKKLLNFQVLKASNDTSKPETDIDNSAPKEEDNAPQPESEQEDKDVFDIYERTIEEEPAEEKTNKPPTNNNAFHNIETFDSKSLHPEESTEPDTESAQTISLDPLPDAPSSTQPSSNPEEESEDGLGFSVEIAETEQTVNTAVNQPSGDYDPTLDLSNYSLPPIDMLEDHDAGNISVSNEELNANKDRIVETLSHYKIEIVDIKAIVGPTITLYEIVPAPGVRISKIKNLEDDIALSLAALGIRIIAPIPGKKAVGIEVPNMKPKVVSMKSIIASTKFQESKYELPLALGKTISNETFVIDLAKAPHLLVAGATGQGKSVGLNAILTSLLYKKHPAQLKMVLVDPKKVELTLYQKIEKHYLAQLPDAEESIITDTQKVVNTLNSLCVEMDSRYDLLKAAHCRNIKEYNTKFISRNLNPEKGHKFLPYIVVVIDEFADLIMTAGKEVELPIARLAQLARAIGIHLIIATQRPTTNIITGLIKANFPARIAFRVTSMMDSRTILDSPGANQLIGRGDMLISQGSDLVRLQCAFVDTPEIEKIMDHIGGQQGYPTAFMLPEYVNEEAGETAEVDLTKRDALFEDAARIVVVNQQGSTSLIQRKFSIGYNRAGRIVDQLEAANIVGPFEGSKARQVLIPDEYSLEQLLNRLNGNE